MPTFGGTPYPRQLGGGNPLLAALVTSIASGRGSHMSKETSSAVYVENVSIARQICASWATNTRLGNLWSAKKCPAEILSRWESMFAIVPGANEPARREALAHKFGLQGQAPELGLIIDECMRVLGGIFVALNTISLANARQLVSVDGSWPFGTVSTDTNWSSTSFRLLILIKELPGQTESQFYDAAGQIVQALDPLLPAWMTFDWYRAPVNYPAVNVTGGPSAGGFYLDDDDNLDNAVFDS